MGNWISIWISGYKNDGYPISNLSKIYVSGVRNLRQFSRCCGLYARINDSTCVTEGGTVTSPRSVKAKTT